MEELFSKVARYVKSASTTLLILEILLTLLVGGIVGALLEEPSHPSVLALLLVVSLPILLGLLCIRAFVQGSFPAAAIEELRCRYQLEGLQKSLARKRAIDGYIDAAIQSLNKQTCSLTQELMTELCERDIEDGLRSVMGAVIQTPNYLMDTGGSDFTVGAYLNYSSVPSRYDDAEHLLWNDAIFVLRDDLDLGEFLYSNLIDDAGAEGISFDLRTSLQWTNNHRKFRVTTLEHDGGQFTMITSPIPQVCEGEWLTGVLFIVGGKLDALPEDLERILLIFNRVLANWLSKYDDCNRNKLRSRIPDLAQAALAAEQP